MEQVFGSALFLIRMLLTAQHRRLDMANAIGDKEIEYISILAKLELTREERELAKTDMGRMLEYIDKMKELDTTGVEPMVHIFPVVNVFREDEAASGDEGGEILQNAPARRGDFFVVPETFSH